MAIDLPTELRDRALHRATIQALLCAVPWREIEAADLQKITPHYQQRISEIRKQSGLRIVNVPRSEVIDGKAHKRDGAYRFEPQKLDGRDPSEPSPERWAIPGAPFGAEPFTLTPPEAR
jgi:hypothetical protein